MPATYILGVHTSHDASACLLRDGEVAVAIEKERLTRSKHANAACSGGLLPIIDYCLQAEGISLEEINQIVVCDIGNLTGQKVIHPREVRIGHHLAHAWAAVGLSGYRDAAVLVVDGEGSYLGELGPDELAAAPKSRPHYLEKESAYHLVGGQLLPLRKWASAKGRGPFSGTDGVASPYWFLSQFMFGRDQQESKVMGLAAYGNADSRHEGVLQPTADGGVEVDPEWIFHLDLPRGQFGKDILAYAPLAASIQAQFEAALLHKADWLRQATQARRLCFTGGAALNCVANSRLRAAQLFEEIFVPFGPGDSSISIGCAYYGWYVLMKGHAAPPPATAYLGQIIDPDTERNAIERYLAHGLIRPPVPWQADSLANEIASGGIVAWFQGRSEFGPRALGNRSILADPRFAHTKDILNDRVKFREPYRPFAPIVLAEQCHDWFSDVAPDARFMQFVARVRPDRIGQLGAVTHVDGTARLQVLAENDNPRLYALIRAFFKLTGVPVMLNTSFNVCEPIVETPADALKTFVCSRIDSLALGDHLLTRNCALQLPHLAKNASSEALRLLWHEPIELMLRVEKAPRFFVQRLSGHEARQDDGYRIKSFLTDEIAVSEGLFAALAELRPLAGCIVQLPAALDPRQSPDLFDEFCEKFLASRVGSLVEVQDNRAASVAAS